MKNGSSHLNSSKKTGFVIAAIVLIALASIGYELLQSIEELQKGRSDPIDALEARLDPVRKELSERAEIGYVTDLDDYSVEDLQFYTQTQYILAPTLVERSLENRLILGNFHSQEYRQAIARLRQNENLRIRKDFGNGVILFGRSGK